MADKHTYDSGDIRRYLQKQMSREEMYAFEKAMMADPFLADALEGFQQADATTSNRHLAEIEQRILGKKEQAKVVPVTSSSKQWLRIAAIFVVIVGISLVTYRLLNDGSGNAELAKNKTSAIEKAEADTARQEVDSIGPATVLPEPGISAEQPLASASKRSGSPIVSEEAAKRTTASAPIADAGAGAEIKDTAGASDMASTSEALTMSAPTAASSKKAESSTLLKQEARQRLNEQEIKGKVVDSKGQPIPFASVSINRTQGTAVDKDGNFKLKAPDTVANVDVSVVGYGTVRATIRSDAENKIVLNESKEGLSEVVVTGKGKMLSGRVAGVDVQNSKNSPVPEGGWANFNRYVDSTVMKAKENNQTNISGNVELAFEVDKQGKPVNIKSIHAPNKEAETKAVDLIKKGPRWKTPRRNAKANVTIQF